MKGVKASRQTWKCKSMNGLFYPESLQSLIIEQTKRGESFSRIWVEAHQIVLASYNMNKYVTRYGYYDPERHTSGCQLEPQSLIVLQSRIWYHQFIISIKLCSILTVIQLILYKIMSEYFVSPYNIYTWGLAI